MDLNALKTLLKRYGFDDSDPLTEWLNSAMHQIVNNAGWPFLNILATVNVNAGAGTITVPGAFFKLVSLRENIVGGNKLQYWEASRFEREIVDFASTGRPEVYTTYGMKDVAVWPTPDAATTFRLIYQAAISDMASGVDTPGAGIVPVGMHYTIVRRAAATALQAENEEDRAATALAEYESDMQNYYDKYLSLTSEGEPGGVVDVWSE